MKIALVQANLHWEDSEKNLSHFSDLLENIENVDLIVLPEMFNTGFTMNSKKVGQAMNGEAVSWLKEMAKKKNAAIITSSIIEENGAFFNRLCWVEPDGKIQTYDKRHLFRMANEHEHFSAGQEKIIINFKGIRFCPQVCYDLRFPVWSRNVGANGNSPIYDCLIYVANWPEVRSDAWTTLLKARAIENQAFVIGVNRVGEDGKGIAYSGESRFFYPKGERKDAFQAGKEMIEIVELDLNELTKFRKKFPVGEDADHFNILT